MAVQCCATDHKQQMYCFPPSLTGQMDQEVANKVRTIDDTTLTNIVFQSEHLRNSRDAGHKSLAGLCVDNITTSDHMRTYAYLATQ